MQTKVRFLDLPGVKVFESRAMIADKFREAMPQQDVDDLSRAIFGVTEAEIGYEPPQWFVDGFDSLEEWNAAPEASDEDSDDDDDDDDDDEDDGDFDSAAWAEAAESPQRLAVQREFEEFETNVARDIDFRDDYERMEYAAALGFDFSDHTNVHPLHVTKLFFRQAVAAARGVKGHMPDMAELGVEEWGAKLADEAKRFKNRNR